MPNRVPRSELWKTLEENPSTFLLVLYFKPYVVFLLFLIMGIVFLLFSVILLLFSACSNLPLNLWYDY